jgi:hypothetical protein
MVLIAYNESIAHGILGRTVTGIIFLFLGVLIVLLKKKRVHYAFFAASFLTLIKIGYGLYETNMKLTGFIISDVSLFVILVVIGFFLYFFVRQ